MIRVEDSIIIQRPIEEVFAYVTDFTNSPQWQMGLLEVHKVTDGSLGIGTQFTFVRKFLGRKLEASNEFIDYKANKLVTFITKTGSLPVTASYLFDPAPDGCKVTCQLEMQPEGFTRLAEPLIASSIKREMRAEFGYLKDLLETQSTEAAR